MKNLLYLCSVLLVVKAISSCQQRQEAQNDILRVDNVQYTAYRWQMADNALGWKLFIVSYINISSDGNYKVMRRKSTVDTAEYFKGKISLSEYPLIDSLPIVSLDSIYIMPGPRVYDGNTYLLSYSDQRERNIHFYPMDAPPFLRRLSTFLNAVVCGSENKIAAFGLEQHEDQLKKKFFAVFGGLPKWQNTKFPPVIDSTKFQPVIDRKND